MRFPPAKKQRGALLNERARDIVRLTTTVSALFGLYLALFTRGQC